MEPQQILFLVPLGAVVAFLTPSGHHGTLLVHEPGKDRFANCHRVGGPLTLLPDRVTAWFAPQAVGRLSP